MILIVVYVNKLSSLPPFGICYFYFLFQFIFSNMVFTTDETVFIVEHYFRSYGVGRSDGSSLLHTALLFQENFHKNPPSSAVNISAVE